MKNELTGGCLCGEVTFTLVNHVKAFYQCHCKQCKQLTGSAFSSNIFTNVDNIEWLTGENNIINYEHPSRAFSKAFCQACGSALPCVNKTKTSLIIPAGSLNDAFDLVPQANIFSVEEASWLKSGLCATMFDGFPE
jgi:hypothetical protein